MAKLKIEINRDTELVRIDDLKAGDIFIYEDEAYIFTMDGDGIALKDGEVSICDGSMLVTYVKKAELKLTI